MKALLPAMLVALLSTPAAAGPESVKEAAANVADGIQAVKARFTAGAAPTVCPAPAALSHRVSGKLSRNPDHYTQGLIFHEGSLYESTGLYGRSGLYKIDPVTGADQRLATHSKVYFGEGLALLNGRLFQLTWKERAVFVYDLTAQSSQPPMSYAGEGWGLTTDGQHLIASDGSSQLYYLDPRDLSVVGTRSVYQERRAVTDINELEFVQGKIFANVFMTDTILRIDPGTGCVDGTLDLTGLLTKAERAGRAHGEVLNGIAFDPAENIFYITGKNWPAIYKMKIGN